MTVMALLTISALQLQNLIHFATCSTTKPSKDTEIKSPLFKRAAYTHHAHQEHDNTGMLANG